VLPQKLMQHPANHAGRAVSGCGIFDMAAAASIGAACNARLVLNTLVIVGAGMMLAACSQLSPLSGQLAAGQSAPSPETTAALASDNRTELQKATEYWGKEFAKNPRDAEIALNYARNLKALGEKRQSLAVLQQASVFNGAHRGINAEYGRLALEFDQVSLAAKLLEQADDPTKPDWKLISARGTVLAKQGRYRDAIPFYERALTLAPDQASILNNLALAHAMEGHPDKAEPLLKRATAAGGHEARVGQNLSLVLGLQGKYDEAKLAAARDQPADNAAANVDYVRNIVKLKPQPMAKAPPEPAPELKGSVASDGEADAASVWAPKVVASKPAR
jgi:Flp pilus assembly protein TadD